jgi:hypothetical protein
MHETSFCSAGGVSCAKVVAGTTTRIYTRGHSSDLHKAASKVEASL